MKYVFFGTPEFAAIILEKLIKAGFVPEAVVCNPDKPVGRKKIITVPAVKVVAQKYNISVLQPENLEFGICRSKALSGSRLFEAGNLEFEKIKNRVFDFLIVASYSKIIPKEILSIPCLGTIGVHPSLLPKYRGASPIQSAILNGDEKTGVSLFLMDEKVDHGPILVARELEIPNSKISAKGEARHRRQIPNKFQIANSKINYEILLRALAELGGDLLIETLPKFLVGEIISQPQDESQATYTKKITTQDAYIEPNDLEKATNAGGEIALVIDRKIRALNPEPGVWTMLSPEQYHSLIRTNGSESKAEKVKTGNNKRVKLLEAKIIEGKLKLTKIQVEGKNPQIIKS